MSDIDVGEGWRRLKPGEVIQEGDQWLANSYANIWYDTESVGDKVRESDPLLYRRRHSPEVAALSDGLSALVARVERIEVANTDGESRAYAQGLATRVVADLIRERDEARKECKKLSAANYALDGVVTALESRVSELKKELKLAKEANAGGFSNQPAVSGDGKSAECGNQEPAKYAVIVGGEMKNTVYDDFGEARDKASDIACRGTPHFVGVVALYREPQVAWQKPVAWGVMNGDGSVYEAFADNEVQKKQAVELAQQSRQMLGLTDLPLAPLYAAPQQQRCWLTDEDRRAVAFAAKALRGHAIAGNLKDIADQLDGLLARETPPRVVLKDFDSSAIPNVDPRYLSGWNQCMNLAKKAIRAAGVEVE